MHIVLIYPPPWKIPAPGENPDQLDDGPPNHWDPEKRFCADEKTLPYGLLSLGAQAKRAGHDVKILNIYAFAWRDVKKIIECFPFELYGLSCMTNNRRGTLALSRLIRAVHPQACIVVGGPHASALPQEMLNHCEAIDGVVIGEGELTFLELIDRLQTQKDISGIAGMAWRDNGQVVIGPPRKRIDDLDTLASPYDYYDGYIILSSRGCYGNCAFCGSPAFWGKKIRFHSAEYTLDMIEQIINRRSMTHMYIKDDTFTSDRKRVLQTCDGIVRRGLNFLWSCDTRVDALDEEMLFAMRKAGCQMISFGVESASREILKNMNKRISPEKTLEATRMAKKFGFQIRYYMIACYRGETAETLKSSIDFIVNAKPNKFFFTFLTLSPGTREFEIAEREGLASREMFFSEKRQHFTYYQPEKCDSQMRQIVDWIDAHRGATDFWDYSVSERENILKLFPDLPAAYMDLGDAHYRAGNLAESERYINLAIDKGYPLAGLGYNYLACIAGLRGDFKGAVDYLGQASSLGRHAVVDKNLKSLRKWLTSGDLKSGNNPDLTANNDLEMLQVGIQPTLPAPIIFHYASEAGDALSVTFTPVQ